MSGIDLIVLGCVAKQPRSAYDIQKEEIFFEYLLKDLVNFSFVYYILKFLYLQLYKNKYFLNFHYD